MRGEPLIVNMVGIEIAADLFLELSVAFVRGIADDIEEFSIAPRAADIFRRAASAGFDQSRIKDARLWIEEPLDLDRALPAIAKVVDVAQRLGADVFDHFVETRLARIEKVFGPIGFGISVLQPRSPARIS